MEAPKDKRTKAYKEWVKKYGEQSKGLGDTVAKMTKATGIESLVKFIAGEDCGCDSRQKKLNEMFRYNKPECLNEYEYNYLKDFFETKSNVVTPKQQKELIKIYNRIFKKNRQPSSCVTCVKTVVKELQSYFKTYE